MRIFEKYLDHYVDEMITSLQDLLRIKSIKEPPLEGKPFGEGSAKALELTLQLGEQLGFTVENFGNYVGHIDYGEQDQIVGILAHTDVVPEGELRHWHYPPYGAEIHHHTLYGRGTLDDKGPLIACLYAMKMIKDLQLPVSKKIRLIAGANEEAGCACIEHYFTTLGMKKPDIAFTPDSEFPVTLAEKGMLKGFFKISTTNKYAFQGGEAGNMVADKAKITLPYSYLETANAYLLSYKGPATFELIEHDEHFTFIATGKSSHASTPEGGVNAISALLSCLAHLHVDDNGIHQMACFFADVIGSEYHGEKLGIAYQDDMSGVLTINFGTLTCVDGYLIISIDARMPVTTDIEHVEKQLSKIASQYGVEYVRRKIVPPVYVPKDSFLVSTLIKAYQTVTDDTTTAATYTGGGTYAKFLDNCVSFGPLLPGVKNTLHQPNECITLNEMRILFEIYAQAIYMLAK